MEAYFLSQASHRVSDDSDALVIQSPLRERLKDRFSDGVPELVEHARDYALNATFVSESTYRDLAPNARAQGGFLKPLFQAVAALKRYKGRPGWGGRRALGITDVGVRPPLEGRRPFDLPDPLQPYLCSKDEHHGIDAYRFTEPSERGSNVEIALVDQGYVAHDDLPCVEEHTITGSDLPRRTLRADSGQHGTAMLGVLVAERDADRPPPWNHFDGIVDCAAKVRLVRFWPAGGGSGSAGIWDSNIFSAITLGILSCEGPAVLVVPVDAVIVRGKPPKWKNSPRLGLEAWPLARALFVLADHLGIIPVVSAGNGYGARIESFAKIQTKDFYPSPAIVVAGGLPRDKGPCRNSNVGKRVDLHCWGKSVTSLYAKDSLTHSFNGTSSATAIVAGAVAGVYSALLEENHKEVRNPSRLVRNILWSTGYLQHSGLGKRPDLAQARNDLEKAGWNVKKLPARICGDWRPRDPSQSRSRSR